MTIAGKRALITGIHGFTGRYMAAELKARGCEVIGIGRQPSEEAGYYQVDLADTAALQSCWPKSSLTLWCILPQWHLSDMAWRMRFIRST